MSAHGDTHAKFDAGVVEFVGMFAPANYRRRFGIFEAIRQIARREHLDTGYRHRSDLEGAGRK